METKRKTLSNNYRKKKLVDMEDVYKELRAGKTVRSISRSLHVSETTLRKRHKEFLQLSLGKDWKAYGSLAAYAGGHRWRKEIDMPYVYRELYKGRTEKSIAEELQVSVTTLRRRHEIYQKKLEEAERATDIFDGLPL